MNELQVFNYSGNEVRTVTKDGRLWLVLKDVVQVLGLTNSRVVKKRLSSSVYSTHPIRDALDRKRETTIINEEGLYDVVIESRKPEARAFRKWVISDVLPIVHKHRAYVSTN